MNKSERPTHSDNDRNGQINSCAQESASKHQQLQKALRESELLRELAELLATSLDLTHILQILVKRTTEACEVRRCAVWLLDNGPQSHLSTAVRNIRSETHYFLPTAYHISIQPIHRRVFQAADRIWHTARIDFNHPFIQRLLQEQGLLIIEDLQAQEKRKKTNEIFLAEKFYIRSIMLIALIRDGRTVGLMTLDNPGQQTQFTSDQIQLARAIGQQAAIAIDNARLLDETQQAMTLSEERANVLNAVYNAMSDGLIVLDKQGQVIMSNQTANTMLGLHNATNHDLAEFLHYHTTTTLSGQAVEEEDFPVSRALHGESIHEERLWIQDIYGNKIATEINVVPLLDNEHNEIGIVSAFHNITDQVRSEQRLRQALHTMLQATEAFSGLMEIDEILNRVLTISLNTINSERGIIQLFSEETQTATTLASCGINDGELALWSSKYQQQVISSPNLLRLKEGRSIIIDPEIEHAQNSEEKQSEILAIPITHQYRLLGLILIDRSIIRHHGRCISGNQQKQDYSLHEVTNFSASDIAIVEGIAQFAGLAINELQLQQEAKIARLNEATMRESNAQKDEILAITAHEFRTPLTIILAHSQMIARILARNAHHSGNHYAQILEQIIESNTCITNQTRQLANIVHLFLDVTHLNQGQISLKKEQIDLATFVKEIVDTYQATTTNHIIRYQLQTNVPCTIEADRARLQQIFANLLQNAIKYSPQGGPITITINDKGTAAMAEEKDTSVVITVSDKGIGVPHADQTHLFESFYRATNIEAAQAGGIGLGLYIVSELLRMHGGTIRVESSGIKGEGSNFIMTFPRLVPSDN